jgi:hypothetical protein
MPVDWIIGFIGSNSSLVLPTLLPTLTDATLCRSDGPSANVPSST